MQSIFYDSKSIIIDWAFYLRRSLSQVIPISFVKTHLDGLFFCITEHVSFPSLMHSLGVTQSYEMLHGMIYIAITYESHKIASVQTHTDRRRCKNEEEK